MADKVRLSMDVPKELRDELKIYASLKGTPVQSIIISQVLDMLRAEALDGGTRYSNIANREVLSLSANGGTNV